MKDNLKLIFKTVHENVEQSKHSSMTFGIINWYRRCGINMVLLLEMYPSQDTALSPNIPKGYMPKGYLMLPQVHFSSVFLVSVFILYFNNFQKLELFNCLHLLSSTFVGTYLEPISTEI